MIEGAQGAIFTEYTLEIVPQFWLLTRRAQSRIFQHLSVPDILKKVLEGLDVTFELQGTFHPRDYCVQYRETDFDFASRLMEEEGILLFLQAQRGQPQDGRGQHAGEPPRPARHVRMIIYETVEGGVRARRPHPFVDKDTGAPLREIHALGPLLRTAAQAPGGQQDDPRQRPGRQA